MTSLTIHGPSESTYVHTLRIILEEKQVPYTLVPVALFKGESRSKEFRSQHHPFGKVPVLYHDDFRIFETRAITRYIERLFPTPAFIPSDPADEATMEQWTSVIDNYLYTPIQRQLFWFGFVAPRFNFPADDKTLASSIKKAPRLLKPIAQLLADSPFLLGDEITLLDAHLAPILHCANLTDAGHDIIALFPNLQRWLHTMQERPSFKNTLSPILHK